ncbi:unnamed protein product [Mytilus coruscus]|uniref:Transcriptional coactivator p15 (PC4) C-terminal domain-containing protein n=1 Tax=Mytilus coruscus TaxID=42192 RepID=A0A6J8EN25_MYTCO|nr:unnamed protein product [Mytilus coruscus]
MTTYRCGCFSVAITHDSFNYDVEGEYNNICGRHSSEQSAKEDHLRQTKIEDMMEKARDVLTRKMDTDRVALHLRNRKVISPEQMDKLSECKSKFLKNQMLIKMIIESENSSLHQLRMALVKAGQTNLLEHISEKQQKTQIDEDNDLDKAAIGRCMIELQGDCHVVAKDHKGQVYINIRNYQTLDGKKYPTKQGVSLTLSRWQMLRKQKDFINNVFKLCLAGEQIDEELIHLGGGV